MEKLLFSDGEQLGYFDGERVQKFDVEYILRYKNYVQTKNKKDEWKFGGEGARFRGDYERWQSQIEVVTAYVNSVAFAGDKAVYCFSVNGASAVYQRELTDGVKEEHILSSSTEEFLTVCYNENGGDCAVTVRADDVTSSIGILHLKSSQLKTLTEGDSRDQNPTFSPTEPNVLYFDTAGVGRTANGEFTGSYSPSQIVKINYQSLEIQEVLSDPKHSFVKPKLAKDGTMYCIQRPVKEGRGGNPVLEILLIPFRIVQAIVLFISSFVTMFTGKSMTSGGSNPARGRESNSQKLFVDGNLIQVEKENKRNKRFKDREYGFIPYSWKLVRVNREGACELLEHGVCDFALTDGGLYFTDGKHVYYRDGKERKKVAEGSCILSVATKQTFQTEGDIFNL